MINSDSSTLIQSLIDGLSLIPSGIALTPVNGKKAPYRSNWQHEKPLTQEQLIAEIKSQKAKGYGIRLGEISGGIVAVDCDGEAAHRIAEQWGGLPETVQFTSGKNGRAQYLYLIPKESWGQVNTRKFDTGEKENGKAVQLELRWNGCQSVLPPSIHPETGRYHWVNGFDKAIAEAPSWVIEKMQCDQPSSGKADNSYSKIDAIPLYSCLSKADRELVDGGKSEGGRNDSGAKLARNLIGTANRMQFLGYRIDDSPEQLFDQYCDRCSPPLPQRERDTIWRSAVDDNPTASLTDEMLENCVKAWQKQQNQPITNSVSVKPNNVVPIRPIPSPEEYHQAVKTLLTQNLSESELELKLQNIAAQYFKQDSQVFRLYKKLLKEDEKQDEKQETAKDLESLLSSSNASIKLEDYLPGNLIKIKEIYQRLCLRPEVGLMQFFTTVSGLLPVGSFINLYEPTDYEEPMGIYFAICAEPSQRKTPGQKAIVTKPLRVLQKQADEQYYKAMEKYQDDIAAWKEGGGEKPEEPKRRVFFLNSATQAGLRNLLQQQQKHGMVIVHDEMAADFRNRAKKYNSGMTEDLLSYYDGIGKREALGDGFASDFDEVLLSVLGSIQPGVIAEFLNGEDDPNGFWARLSIVNQPIQALTLPENRADRGARMDLTPLLAGFYEKAANLPRLCLRLSPEAEDLMVVTMNRIDQRRVQARTQGIAAQWGKLSGKIGRLAALIHVIDNLAIGENVDNVVDVSTLQKAINLGRFLIDEAISLYADNTEGNLAAHLKQILAIAQNVASLSAREVVMKLRTCRKTPTETIRGYFDDLAQMGYGVIIGSGSRRKFKFEPKSVDKSVDSLKTPSCIASSNIEPKSVDKRCQNVNGLKPLSDKDYSQTVDNVDKNQFFEQKTMDEPPDIGSKEGMASDPPNSKNQENVNIVNDVNSLAVTPPEQGIATVDKSVASTVNDVNTFDLMDFYNLKPGDVVFDESGNIHQITKIQSSHAYTHRKAIISRADWQNGAYHLIPTDEELIGLMERVKSQQQYEFLEIFRDRINQLIEADRVSDESVKNYYSF